MRGVQLRCGREALKMGKFPIIREPFGQKDIDARRKQEKSVFLAMSEVYCKGMKHDGITDVTEELGFDEELQTYVKWSGWKVRLCPECLDLVKESAKHTNRCRHLAYKTFCHHCPTPCYAQSAREKIRPIMRYSGPRIMTRHPVLGVQYMVLTARHARIIKRYERKNNQT